MNKTKYYDNQLQNLINQAKAEGVPWTPPRPLTLNLGPTQMKTTWQQWLHRIATTILAILQALQIGGTI